ncbi:hypothetical protein [Paenibacillus amylolyticus]|uniref:hypothetical protein n=1 Tax=Paenibacillus sp. M2 TaxID=3341793 RepID=UPI000B828CB8|nr:hypothetical protein [Paenibacillus amylolyticus]
MKLKKKLVIIFSAIISLLLIMYLFVLFVFHTEGEQRLIKVSLVPTFSVETLSNIKPDVDSDIGFYVYISFFCNPKI